MASVCSEPEFQKFASNFISEGPSVWLSTSDAGAILICEWYIYLSNFNSVRDKNIVENVFCLIAKS